MITAIRLVAAAALILILSLSSALADAATRAPKKRFHRVVRPPVPVPVFTAPPSPPMPPLAPPVIVPRPVNPPGTPPKMANDPALWFPASSYPALAKRANLQGRVTVRLRLDKTGRPYQCTVVGSSGSDLLDTTTCYLAQTNARFTPALDPQGKPMEWTYQLSTRWVLEEDAPPPAPPAPPLPFTRPRR